jgi:hypothetical protein
MLRCGVLYGIVWTLAASQLVYKPVLSELADLIGPAGWPFIPASSFFTTPLSYHVLRASACRREIRRLALADRLTVRRRRPQGPCRPCRKRSGPGLPCRCRHLLCRRAQACSQDRPDAYPVALAALLAELLGPHQHRQCKGTPCIQRSARHTLIVRLCTVCSCMALSKTCTSQTTNISSLSPSFSSLTPSSRYVYTPLKIRGLRSYLTNTCRKPINALIGTVKCISQALASISMAVGPNAIMGHHDGNVSNFLFLNRASRFPPAVLLIILL